VCVFATNYTADQFDNRVHEFRQLTQNKGLQATSLENLALRGRGLNQTLIFGTENKGLTMSIRQREGGVNHHLHVGREAGDGVVDSETDCTQSLTA